MSRPRLNLAPLPTSPAETVSPGVPLPVSAAAVDEIWERPEIREIPSLTDDVRVEVGEYRRSNDKKTNRTVSVPLNLAAELRRRSSGEGWSITDFVFVAVEQYREKLRATPTLPGRIPGPSRDNEGRAHVVLYLADSEWQSWKDSANFGGLGPVSKLVSEALRFTL